MQPLWKATEIRKIVEFIGEELKTAEPPINIKSLLEKCRRDLRIFRASDDIQRKLKECITKDQNYLEHFDAETKIKLLQMLKIPIGDALLKQLRKTADVELDSCFQISKYRTHVKRNTLSKKTSEKPSADNEPVEKMLNFIENFSRTQDSPVTNDTLAEEYIEFTGAAFPYRLLSERFRVVVKPLIQTSKQFDVQTRARMMFVTKNPVGGSFLVKMKQIADVRTDHQNRIIIYKAHDGSLKLRKYSGKRANSYNEKPKHRERSVDRYESDKKDTKRLRMDDKGGNCSKDSEKPKFYARRTGVTIASTLPFDLVLSSDSEDEPCEIEETIPISEDCRNLVDVKIETPVKQEEPDLIIEESKDYIPPMYETPFQYQAPLSNFYPEAVHSFVGVDTPSTGTSEHSYLSTQFNFSPSAIEDISVEYTSIKEFLKLLRIMVLTVDSQLLAPIELKIKNWIELIGDEKVSVDNVILSLKTFIRLIIGKSSRLSDNSTSFPLQKIITLITSLVYSLDFPNVEELQAMIRSESSMLDPLDDKVPAKYMELALETTIGLITPRFFHPQNT
uniref:SPK domain-containing protein n=1 Tax=Caenorhabditis tropicalis TaxID=1561998 RepID=A0A1I7TXY4_9PELO